MAWVGNQNECPVCRQPRIYCVGRSKRDAGKVEMMMVPSYQNFLAVPCCFREQLNSFLSTKKWLIVKCWRGYKYDLFVEKFDAQSFLCGPYWRQLVACYNVNTFDKLTLYFDPEDLEVEGEYQAEFTDFVDNHKDFAIPSGQGFLCNHMLSMSRQTLQKTVFSNISDITASEMCEVNWLIFKEIRFFYLLNKDEDFHDLDQFLDHRMREQDLIQLAIPGEVSQGFRIPCFGYVEFANNNIDELMYGAYEYHKGKDNQVGHGWTNFCEEAGIEAGSLIMVLIEMRELCIRLEVSVLN